MATYTIPNRSSFPLFFRRLCQCGLSLIVACLVMALATTAIAQEAKSKPTLVPGSEVNLSAITKTDWIQGEGPTAFEPGKVYVFECWATWCGPCVALIPHVNDLHKKYYDQGLRVHGMNVWEDDRKKVVEYVKAKGDGMSYPVSFNDGSAFETDWLKAAGVESIPHAFVVRNGKLLLATEAVRLTDSLVELMLSGDEGAKQAAAKIKTANDNFEATEKIARQLYKAGRKKDAETMAAKLKELETLDPDHPELSVWKLRLLMAQEKWPAATVALNEMPMSNAKISFLLTACNWIAHAKADTYPMNFTKAFTTHYAAHVTEKGKEPGPNAFGPSHFTNLSILCWRTGDKEAAISYADKGVEVAMNFKAGNSEARTSAYKRFAESVKEGTMPTFSNLIAWQNAARKLAPKKEAAEAKE